jgi:hypothetical protein
MSRLISFTNPIVKTIRHPTSGLPHCLEGHAVEYLDGTKFWFVNGGLHRLDGPAVEYPDGIKQWWISGKWLFKEQFDQHPLVVFYRLCKGVV